MNVKWLAFASVVPLAIGALPAAAQEATPRSTAIDYRFELFGDVGWARLGADEGSRGGGPLLAAGFGFRPFRRFGFEVEAGFSSNRRGVPGGAVFEGELSSVTGNVLYHFSESRTQWYVLFGLGWASEDQRSIFYDARFPEPDRIFEYADEYVVWNVGVGFKRFLTPRLLVRPEVRYATGGPLGVLGLLRLTIGVGYVW